MPSYMQNTAAELLTKGVYPFRVRSAKETTSQNGNEKIELTLQVNGTFTVYDNLTFVENSFWKIDQFRVATGEVLGKPGSDVTLTEADCIDRRGELEIDIDEFPKNSGRKRNIVTAYIDPKQQTAAPKPGNSNAGSVKRPDPDNIPF